MIKPRVSLAARTALECYVIASTEVDRYQSMLAVAGDTNSLEHQMLEAKRNAAARIAQLIRHGRITEPKMFA